jgi:hypothetical protein
MVRYVRSWFGVTVLLAAGAAPCAENLIYGDMRPALEVSNARDESSGPRNYRSRVGWRSVVHVPALGDRTAIEVLLEAGAPIDAIDNSGHSALNYAATHGTSSTVYRRLNTAKHKSNEFIVVIPQ